MTGILMESMRSSGCPKQRMRTLSSRALASNHGSERQCPIAAANSLNPLRLSDPYSAPKSTVIVSGGRPSSFLALILDIGLKMSVSTPFGMTATLILPNRALFLTHSASHLLGETTVRDKPENSSILSFSTPAGRLYGSEAS